MVEDALAERTGTNERWIILAHHISIAHLSIESVVVSEHRHRLRPDREEILDLRIDRMLAIVTNELAAYIGLIGLPYRPNLGFPVILDLGLEDMGASVEIEAMAEMATMSGIADHALHLLDRRAVRHMIDCRARGFEAFHEKQVL